MVVPADWKFVELGSVVSTGQLGGNYPNSSVSDGFPLIKMGNLGRGKIDMSSRYFLARGLSPSSLDILKPNDVLFNTRNTLDLVGKVAIWRNELPGACYNSNIMRLSFDSFVVCNEYANYALNTSVSTKALREMATGTTSVAAIYGRDLWLLPFLLPPLKEQEAIAEALSDADAAIESLDALIAKKRDVKQATMQQLLTGRTRLPGFTADWKEVRLGDLGPLSKGVGIKKNEVTPYGIPCVRYGQIYTHYSFVIGEIQTFVSPQVARNSRRLRKGEILFASSGETKLDIGKCVAYVEDVGAVAGGDIIILTQDGADSRFLGYLLNSPFVAQQKMSRAQGDAVVHISAANLSSIVLGLPPMGEQEAIAEALTVMDDELEALTQQASKLRMVKEGMMQNLLTGKVRLA